MKRLFAMMKTLVLSGAVLAQELEPGANGGALWGISWPDNLSLNLLKCSIALSTDSPCSNSSSSES